MGPPLAPRLVCLLIMLALVVLIQAEYFIDDSNLTVIQYSSNYDGPSWGSYSGKTLSIIFPDGSNTLVDGKPCYDGTFTYAACKTTDNCKLQFSFTGSGITFYVLHAGAQGISAKISIDDQPPITQTLDAPPGPQYYQPNASFYDVQSLPSATHTFNLLVLSWGSSFSGMMFDYAVVNETFVAPPPTSSSSMSTSSSATTQATAQASTKSSSGQSKVGTIASVVIVLVVVVLLIVLAILYYRRQQNNRTNARDSKFQVDPIAPNATPDMCYSTVPSTPVGQNVGATKSSLPSSHRWPTGPASPLQPSAANLVLSSSGTTGTLPPDLSAALADSHITNEQVDFVRELYAHNVPIPAIARVLERMSSNRDAPPDYSTAN